LREKMMTRIVFLSSKTILNLCWSIWLHKCHIYHKEIDEIILWRKKRDSQNLPPSFINALSVLIMWEFWRSRCTSKHENETPSIQISELLVFFITTNTTSLKFENCSKTMVKTFWWTNNTTVYKIVKETKPTPL